jgi:hypothetical protein
VVGIKGKCSSTLNDMMMFMLPDVENQ